MQRGQKYVIVRSQWSCSCCSPPVPNSGSKNSYYINLSVWIKYDNSQNFAGMVFFPSHGQHGPDIRRRGRPTRATGRRAADLRARHSTRRGHLHVRKMPFTARMGRCSARLPLHQRGMRIRELNIAQARQPGSCRGSFVMARQGPLHPGMNQSSWPTSV